MTKKKNNRVSKTERFMYKSFIFMSLILVVGIILTKATLSQVNLEVQKLNNKIKSQKEDNQSLVMKINEMVSLENIQEVSNEYGLAYINDNIKKYIKRFVICSL